MPRKLHEIALEYIIRGLQIALIDRAKSCVSAEPDVYIANSGKRARASHTLRVREDNLNNKSKNIFLHSTY